MKFKDMPYERADAEAFKKNLEKLTDEFKAASSYETAKEVFLKQEKLSRHFETLYTIASIRQSINTKDKFYDEEMKYYNRVLPEVQTYLQNWSVAMLSCPFRAEFEKEYGEIIFINTELELKAFSPDIIPQLQKENELVTEYGKLIASADVKFEGETYTLSQMTPFKTDADDRRREAAWIAEGKWYKDNQDKLDDYYDRLVHLRDEMGRKLGFDGYTELGYLRMSRNCYDKNDIEKFRAAVVKYLVPVAEKVCRMQAERMGFEYPMSFAEEALDFRSGNPKPQGSAQDILNAGLKFYTELSPETGEFFSRMLEDELMDVLSTEGKSGGGYCTTLPDYEVPFIFANFNGTQGDVDVVTHEAGHAFEAWMNRSRVPMSTVFPSMEAAEVHSMSMEFFAENWSQLFFGDDADKYRFSHLASALTFIPYGTMVDHFQHEVYEKPNMTPRERHDVWKRLLGVYMPWLKLDGNIPFYSDGEGWQRQQHIYSSPFYYIDYCLAQTVSLEFWAMIKENPENAWEHYMAYTKQGGSKVFTKLLEGAGLVSPFDEECLKTVSETAIKFLENFDMSSIC